MDGRYKLLGSCCLPERWLFDWVDFLRKVVSMSGSLRSRENLSLKQPLSTLYVSQPNNYVSILLSLEPELRKPLYEECNVDEIRFVNEGLDIKFLSVNFKEAGKILKGDAQKLKQWALDRDLYGEWKTGQVQTPFGELSSNLFEVQSRCRDELVSLSDNNLTVALDTTLTEDLKERGVLRNLMRSVQMLRQKCNLELTQRMLLSFFCDTEKTSLLFYKYKEAFMEDALCESFYESTQFMEEVELDHGFGKVSLSLKSV